MTSTLHDCSGFKSESRSSLEQLRQYRAGGSTNRDLRTVRGAGLSSRVSWSFSTVSSDPRIHHATENSSSGFLEN